MSDREPDDVRTDVDDATLDHATLDHATLDHATLDHATLDPMLDLTAPDDAFLAGLGPQERREQLEVRALLAALPDPGPMPPEVVDRITANLRALAEADMAPEPRGRSGSTVVPLARAHSAAARRRHPLLAVAAAAVVLGGGGYVASQVVPDVSADSSASVAGGSSRPRGGTGVAGAARGLAGAAPVLSTGTDYRADTLTAQVTALLTDRASTQTTTSTPTAGLARPDALAACVGGLGADPGSVLAADLATYDGTPAAVLVLRVAGGGREVWVVSPDCRPGQDGTRRYLRLP